MAKKREYGNRIREVEYAVFTPLVFSTMDGMRKETTVAYKRLAELLAQKRKSEYGITLAWMKWTLLFCLDTIICYGNKRESFCFKPESRYKH